MNFLGYLSDGQVVFKSCFEHCPTCEGRLICPEEHVSSLNKCNPIRSQVSGLKSQVFRGYLGFCQSHVPGSPGKSQVIVPSCSSPGKSLDIPGHGMFQYHPRFSQAPGITWDNLGLFQSQIVPGNPRLSQVFLKSREIPGYPRSWHVPIPSQVPGQPGTWEKLGFWPGTVQGYPRISREVYLAGVTPLLTHWKYVSFALGSIVMMYFFRRCHSGSSYLKHHVTSCFHFECITPATVNKYISELAAKNSCGPDNISSILLKRLATHVVSPLTVMINQSLCTGIFPEKLKVAKVIPLYKKGDNHLFDNYRPISLLSTVSKIFEKTVFTQVYNYFCAHKLFYESQYGFRKCHSTELAAIELVDRLCNYLDAGKVPVSVFLDLSKAFDTLNHTILIEKLRYYGLNDTSLNWFHSYLHDRLQFTKYNSVCSDVVTLSTGVPQGSILGPLLFIIYMN